MAKYDLNKPIDESYVDLIRDRLLIEELIPFTGARKLPIPETIAPTKEKSPQGFSIRCSFCQHSEFHFENPKIGTVETSSVKNMRAYYFFKPDKNRHILIIVCRSPECSKTVDEYRLSSFGFIGTEAEFKTTIDEIFVGQTIRARTRR